MGKDRVNINVAPRIVLSALHDNMTDDLVEQIIRFREGPEGPFTFNAQRDQLSTIVGAAMYDEINSRITAASLWFQIIAKAEYGTSTYFLRSYVYRYKAGEMPSVRSIELF